ncbi:MAG: peptidoglycan bridge formation glycyltransferase FemA/FemB family protein [Spirochaetales bacterium]|nr:peptidoglycan bridge formation glycyltransferase FemA/FemB family protein [Spirochaetales bacterium]
MNFTRIPLAELSEKSNLLQTEFWGRFKAESGFRADAFAGYGGQLLVLSRKIRFLGWMSYIPHAPKEVPDIPLADFCAGLLSLLPVKPFVLRLDLPWTVGAFSPDAIACLRKSVADIQVPHTVLIPLDGSGDELLARMKPKTRYNIRLAEKKGVTVSEAGRDGLADWYELHRITARRDKISIRSFSYYVKLYDMAEKHTGIKPLLYFARHEQDLLAGIYVLHHGERASYLYGASSNTKRNLMPAYALQWKAICAAREAGCLEYDMCGIPEADDPEHPMHGLYRFKTGFGGNIVHRPGCMDFPAKPFRYSLSRQAEKARYYYHKVWRKR